jgi:predicted aspartyl protease
MIVLTLEADPRGRAIIEVFLTASVPRVAAMEALGERPPSPISVRALVDTGASRTNVQKSVLEQLGLEPIGEESVHTASTAGSPRAMSAYTSQLFLAGVPAGQIATDLRVVEAEDLSALGVEMLLGVDILNRCLLFFNGPEGRFTIAFSPAEARP